MEKVDNHTELETAIKHLTATDSVMSGLIEQYGPFHLTRTDDYFFTLVDAIASQQLSSKVAATIVGRIRALVPGKERIEAEDLLAVQDQTLRDIGLSWGKVSYVKDLAARVASGEVHLGRISEMEDEQVINELVIVKGIGRWTAEMFLMFSLARPDVLAVGDYGLQAAMKRLYNLPELPKPALMREIGEPWRPYRSHASLYLWRSVGGTVG